jgi:hypothetical protein
MSLAGFAAGVCYAVLSEPFTGPGGDGAWGALAWLPSSVNDGTETLF